MSPSDAQIRDAVIYNLGQGFSVEEIKQIQQTTGATVDGLWGPETVGAVWRWQARHGIRPDGKVWRNSRGNTWPHIAGRPPVSDELCLGRLRVGLWIDDPPRLVNNESYADRLLELGVSTAAVMVTRANGTAAWNVQQVECAARLFREREIELVLTAWPYPRRKSIDDVCQLFSELAAVSGPVGFEVDLEGNWLGRNRRGFSSMSQAGDYLLDRLRAVAEPIDARLELTSYPYHTEFSSRACVAPNMDVVLPQAYSVHNRGENQVGWSDRLGPGRMQNLSIERARTVNSRVVCGLAAYGQQWPGRSGEEAMGVAWQAVVEAGCQEVRYWSSKWVLGGRSSGNAYAARFLSTIATGC
jgi:hypothetical protein